MRQWRIDNPEKVKLIAQKSYEKLRNDPEKWANFLEYRRNWYLDPENKRKVRSNFLKFNYGIDIVEYERLFDLQGGVCAICNLGVMGNLSVDHDHETGEVRGLLCDKCNEGIGCLKEDPGILLKAVEYLNNL